MSFQYSRGIILEESVSSVTLTPSRNLGDRMFYQGDEYVYCFNAGGAAIGTNLVVKLVTASSGYSVAATALTDVFSPAVGVTKNTSVVAAGYFWAMTKGYCSLTPTSAITFADAYTPLAAGAAGQVVAWAATGATQGIKIAHVGAVNASAGVSGMAGVFLSTGY